MYLQYTLTTVSVKLLFMAFTIFKLILPAINCRQHSCQSIADRFRHSASRVSMRVCLRRCSRKQMFISRSVSVNLTYFKHGWVQTNCTVCFSGLSLGRGWSLTNSRPPTEGRVPEVSPQTGLAGQLRLWGTQEPWNRVWSSL